MLGRFVVSGGPRPELARLLDDSPDPLPCSAIVDAACAALACADLARHAAEFGDRFTIESLEMRLARPKRPPALPERIAARSPPRWTPPAGPNGPRCSSRSARARISKRPSQACARRANAAISTSARNCAAAAPKPPTTPRPKQSRTSSRLRATRAFRSKRRPDCTIRFAGSGAGRPGDARLHQCRRRGGSRCMGVDRATLGAVVADEDPAHFRLDAAAFVWRDVSAGRDAVGTARMRGLRSYGSCSFVEPVEDLRASGILPRPMSSERDEPERSRPALVGRTRSGRRLSDTKPSLRRFPQQWERAARRRNRCIDSRFASRRGCRFTRRRRLGCARACSRNPRSMRSPRPELRSGAPCARGSRRCSCRVTANSRCGHRRESAGLARRRRAAAAAAGWGLRRLLLVARTRDEFGEDLAARQRAAAAELAAACRSVITAAAERWSSAGRRSCGLAGSSRRQSRGRAAVRADAHARLRARTRFRHRERPAARLADSDRTRARLHLRGRAAQRLERARHPSLGVPAARAVPRQIVRDVDLAVDRHARGARAVSRAGPVQEPRAAAVSARARGGGLRHRRSKSNSRRMPCCAAGTPAQRISRGNARAIVLEHGAATRPT